MLYILNIHSDSNILFGGSYFFKSVINFEGLVVTVRNENKNIKETILCFKQRQRKNLFVAIVNKLPSAVGILGTWISVS